MFWEYTYLSFTPLFFKMVTHQLNIRASGHWIFCLMATLNLFLSPFGYPKVSWRFFRSQTLFSKFHVTNAHTTRTLPERMHFLCAIQFLHALPVCVSLHKVPNKNCLGIESFSSKRRWVKKGFSEMMMIEDRVPSSGLGQRVLSNRYLKEVKVIIKCVH